ncbi:hypothetical protein INT47_006670 [Mucor saturninus]|uniref:Tetrapyrrole biosynthesis uroporphyrinogen III synthase domain-containing protein n=1 Tax=Mucor saturninus TaxID=64648 RepID=A0A8H7QSI3_9FUNG|nr:hypothetical protein INT47_006670 [Mucor saturninus]
MTKRVVLFKKKDTHDAYDELFTAHGFSTQFIPVLDHVSTHIDTIKDILTAGPERFSALILTSHRSVHAMAEAYDQITFMSEQTKAAWNRLPVYLVGPHTAHVLSNELPALFNDPSHWTVAPRALELLPHLMALPTAAGELLFLAGDKRRDLIPTELKAARFHVHEIQSYATTRHANLPNRLSQLTSLSSWYVYFSPSGLHYVLDCIDPHQLNGYLAAIGPTTAEAMEQAGLKPDVTSSAPDAQHLLDAIVRSMK